MYTTDCSVNVVLHRTPTGLCEMTKEVTIRTGRKGLGIHTVNGGWGVTINK